MSSVLVIIIIPDSESEVEIAKKEKIAREFSRKNLKKDLSVTLEADEEDEAGNSLENVIKNGLTYLGINDAAWQKTLNNKYWHISFPVDLQDSDIVIQYFKSRGIGLHLNSSIGIIPFTLYCYNEELENDAAHVIESNHVNINKTDEQQQEIYASMKEKQNKFIKSITARLTVAQIVNSVRENATLTFDFLCYLIFASWIAAMGLLDNSVISLVASMLVSPMMGPVMAMTFGTIIKDRSLRNMGIKNIFVCLFGTILFGFVFGLIALNFTEQWTNSYGLNSSHTWPTDMMRERGLVRITWIGTLVAFPSGCAVAISLLSGNDASLVGVAISVSLLPPAVNAGLLWAFSLLKVLYSLADPGSSMVSFRSHFNESNIVELSQAFIPLSDYVNVYSDNMALETLYLGLFSLLLSLINIANIIIGALLLLKIKEIAPLSNLSPVSRRFFQEDIKIAREYNEKSGTNNLEEGVLKEYASLHNLDSEKFMKPESRDLQLQALADIVKDVEADEVYQTVTRSVHNTDSNLARRLSQSLFVNESHSNQYGRRRTFAAIFNNHPTLPTAPTIVVSPEIHNQRRPSYAHLAGQNRRRISNVAFVDMNNSAENNCIPPLKTYPSQGYVNKAFSFNEKDIKKHYDHNKHPNRKQHPDDSPRF